MLRQVNSCRRLNLEAEKLNFIIKIPDYKLLMKLVLRFEKVHHGVDFEEVRDAEEQFNLLREQNRSIFAQPSTQVKKKTQRSTD